MVSLPVLVSAAAVLTAGCVPIPTTLGHGASVLSSGLRLGDFGAGGKYHLDRPNESIPYFTTVGTYGLGAGLESELAVAGFNLYPSLTWQLVGERRESPTQSCALALSAGASYGFNAGWSGFVGAIASRPFGERTWYVAYRRHSGDMPDEDAVGKRFVQDIVFLGVEWSPTLSMELFFMWTVDHDNDHDKLPADGIGFNFFRYEY